MSIADELREYADEIRPDIDRHMYFWLQDFADRIECGETHLAERHLPWDNDDEYWLYCDECGYWLYMRKAFSKPRYCSHCGRKAVAE